MEIQAHCLLPKLSWSSRVGGNNEILLFWKGDTGATCLLGLTCIIKAGYRFYGVWVKHKFSRSCFSSAYAGSERELITRLAKQESLLVGKPWKEFIHSTEHTTLEYSYRVMCDEYYYGPECIDLCKPRDDQFGHYTCDENGNKVCNQGWTGEYCDQGNYIGVYE